MVAWTGKWRYIGWRGVVADMLYRRKVLLRFLKELHEPTTLRLQKLLFLYRGYCSRECYDFFPNKYGCYSLVLHNDRKFYERQGTVTVVAGSTPIESRVSLCGSNVDGTDLSLKPDDEIAFSKVIALSGCMDDASLIDYTYHLKPQYAYRSCLLSRFTDDIEFANQIFKVKEKICSMPHCLYTIGYEGVSIDTFIKKLLFHNIRTLVDVRKNAFSMRPEFCMGALSKALDDAGIRYLHHPEVGIASAKRNELLPDNRREELFEWYERDTLPACRPFVDSMSDIFKTGSLAFMCYERNPLECHRSHLATYCLEVNPGFGMIKHL